MEITHKVAGFLSKTLAKNEFLLVCPSQIFLQNFRIQKIFLKSKFSTESKTGNITKNQARG